jgi:hypothetical protein
MATARLRMREGIFNKQIQLIDRVGESYKRIVFTYGSISITGVSYRKVSVRIYQVKKG